MNKSYLLALLMLLSTFFPEQAFSNPGHLANSWRPFDPNNEARRNEKWRLASLITSSTPPAFRVSPERTAENDKTVATYDVDSDGFISNIRVTKTSYSLAQDFWTIWGLASCPPEKSIGTSNQKLKISNSQFTSGILGGDAQRALMSAIPRNRNAKSIYFPLIPAAFIDVFPEKVVLKDLCTKTNLVGISVKTLTQNGAKSWSAKTANDLIHNRSSLSNLLTEWPAFFRKHSKPTAHEIFSFSDSLKMKYKNLLEEEKPEAPLP